MIGGRVLDVLAVPPRDLVLVLEPEGASEERAAPLRLVLSADPDGPRVFLRTERVPRHAGPLGPFFRQVAGELTGARLTRLEQVAADRILRLEFGGAPSGERRVLFAEFVGRHANLLLAGPGEKLLDWLVPPPPSGAKPQRLALGSAWVAPPGRPHAGAEVLPLCDAIAAPEEPAPACFGGRAAPLSWRVEQTLGQILRVMARERAARDLRERLQRKFDRARGLVAGLEQRLQAVEGSERVLQDGELLKANLSRIARGAKSIEVQDWFADPPTTRSISVDPRRSPQENLNAIFERYHKLERSAASVQHELQLARAKALALENSLGQLSAPESNPAEIESAAIAAGWIDPPQEPDERKRKDAPARKPFREFKALRGGSILVGRTAKDNDELTLRLARGNDLWLHTRDTPGSHVILRLERGAEPDPEEVLDAATLAVHFSPLAEATKAAVHVARRKQVHKPRGAKPGLVALSGGKTLEVRMQPERLRRLLSSLRATPGTQESPPQDA